MKSAHIEAANFIASLLEHYFDEGFKCSAKVAAYMAAHAIMPQDIRAVIRSPTEFKIDRAEDGGAWCSIQGFDLDGRYLTVDCWFESQNYLFELIELGMEEGKRP